MLAEGVLSLTDTYKYSHIKLYSVCDLLQNNLGVQ